MPLHTYEELLNKIEAALKEAVNYQSRLVGFQVPQHLISQLDITAALAREALLAVEDLRTRGQ